MTRGVGLYRKIVAKSSSAVRNLLRTLQDHYTKGTATASPSQSMIKRVTVASVGKEVIIVEEWDSKADYDESAPTSIDALSQAIDKSGVAITSHTTEYFPESYHLSNPIDSTTETVGILVRQKTSSTANGEKLRDAQKEAYERQMLHEPGCTCCIILAKSQQDDTQVRIIELWKTMNDFYFHENSEWHELGEEKVVPLVKDMDCDFVKGYQLLQT